MKTENQNKPSEANLTGIAARETAVRVLMAVSLKNRPLEIAFDDMASEAKLDSRDRAFALNIVMLSLRRYGSLNYIASKLLDRGLPQNATWTKAAIVIGLAQILFMRAADFAAAHQMVELIKRLPGKEKGFSGLVNAVLRRAVREKDKLLDIIDNDPNQDLPKWLRDRWTKTYGADATKKLAMALRNEPMLDISVKNPAEIEAIAESIDAQAMPTGSLRRSFTDVKKLEGYDEGKWWVQDLSASLPAKLFPDLKGKHVLDMCAAPGGKTMQLGSLGANVTAIDRSKNRLRRLQDNLDRTKLSADIFTADAASYSPKKPVDHILLDAPCSATGTYRRNPDLMIHKSPEDIQKLSSLQARILNHAYSLLPVGGTLIYCVCSIEAEEGIEQINHFLSENPTAERHIITAEDVDGIEEIVTQDGDILCLPHHVADIGGMDGFYISRLTKCK
ncbi:RsmB/NOP family class I SAM-dependent RNA methyltransferase [Kordiimonas sp. SCSIO 12610]|uniref:RsmB/NOP family class I SAM-dependent RNA methyltransferase n=1 Tax=Kordiimonas sp. SCSIO 12610 TaxID=2829597 RepID=UPI00210D83F1|nr:transcription antitermination factor NusB [Kordiimonas sp. SCSIO 12610]UTW55564.1 hypothetical protein KFF44_01325 [Kordiimonas sp. SCSIO 12610]